MGISSSWACCGFLLYLALFQTPFPILLVTAQPCSYLIANSSTSWTNSPSAPNSVKFEDGSFVRIILSSQPSNIYQDQCTHFAIFSLYYLSANTILSDHTPHVLWSANPKNPVSYNATLHLTSDRDLVLQNVDGTIAGRQTSAATNLWLV
ncbi:hypothetical protein CFP56_040099 [Quercus suber]|uniref:Bulb-type lectin domain-containing protein n=1 Tax=Quercus suber TaxID=58331 RepID=A0AAW0LKI7_QUESU